MARSSRGSHSGGTYPPHQRETDMNRTRTAARLGATTVTGAWLIAAAATSAWAVPGPLATPGPAASSATVQATAGDTHRAAATRPADLRNKIAAYERYLAREEAQAALAAKRPALPGPPPQRPAPSTSRAERAIDTDVAGWTVGGAAAGGLILGAGLTLVATRYLLPRGRLHHA